MIQPEADLSLNHIVVAADIIEHLKKAKKSIIVEKVLKNFLKKDKRRTHNLFFEAVTFLSLLNCISIRNYKIKLLDLSPKQSTLFDFLSEEDSNG